MIRKTVRIFKRYAKTWRGNRIRKDDTHVESVVRETWWLFAVLPIYSREAIRDHNM